MLLFFYVLHSVKFKKNSPIFEIVVEYGHCACLVFLHLWNVNLLPLELAGLECHQHHIIFIFFFSNRTQILFIVPILLLGNVSKECTIVRLLYPV